MSLEIMLFYWSGWILCVSVSLFVSYLLLDYVTNSFTNWVFNKRFAIDVWKKAAELEAIERQKKEEKVKE